MDTMRRGQIVGVKATRGMLWRRAHKVAAGLVLMLCSAVILSLIGVCTDDRSLRNYYGRCIDRKILQYEHNPDLLYLGVGYGASCNVHALEKVRFYEENRDNLIAQLEHQAVGKDPQEVERILHKAYDDARKRVTARAGR